MRKAQQHINEVHGWLTITAACANTERGDPRVVAQCKCGVVKEFVLGNILSKRTKSCGCYRASKKNVTPLLMALTHNTTASIEKLIQGGEFVYNNRLYKVVEVTL